MPHTTASSPNNMGSKSLGRTHPRHQIERKTSEKHVSSLGHMQQSHSSNQQRRRRSSEEEIVSHAQAQRSTVWKAKKDREDHSGARKDKNIFNQGPLRRGSSWSDGHSSSEGSDASNVSCSSSYGDNSSHGRSSGGNCTRASTQDSSDFDMVYDHNLSWRSPNSAETPFVDQRLDIDKLVEGKHLSERPQGNRRSSVNHTDVESFHQQRSGSSSKLDQMAEILKLQSVIKATVSQSDLEVLPRRRLPGFSNGQGTSAEAVRVKIEATLALATLTLLCSSDNECTEKQDNSLMMTSSTWRNEFAGITALRTILVHAFWILAPAPPAVHGDTCNGATSRSNTSAGTLPPGAGAAALEAFVLRLVQLARCPIEAVAEVHCFSAFNRLTDEAYCIPCVHLSRGRELVCRHSNKLFLVFYSRIILYCCFFFLLSCDFGTAYPYIRTHSSARMIYFLL